MLNQERQEKDTLQGELESLNSRMAELQREAEEAKEALATAKSASEQQLAPDTDYKVKLVEERNKLLQEKSELQDKILHHIEESKILKETLDETQLELESLVNEHERLTSQLQEMTAQLKEAHELPGKLRLEAQGIRDQLDEKREEVQTL